MDMSTVKLKLESQEYQSAKEFFDERIEFETIC